MDVITEVINSGSVMQGGTAEMLLANNMDVKSLRTNATLRPDEWKAFDATVVETAKDRMVGWADLVKRGLVYTIPNGMGVTVFESETMSDMNDAVVDMAGITKGANDRVDYSIGYLPLPIVHKEFQINARALAASRSKRMALDTTQAMVSTRKVVECVETMLFNGYNSFTYGGGIIYGYTDFPSRNRVTLTTSWTDSSMDGGKIFADVSNMKQALIEDNYEGPYVLYIPKAYSTLLDEDFKANGALTIRQRLLLIDGITDIVVSSKLTTNNVLLVQMTSDVVRMVEGVPLTTIQEKGEFGMLSKFKVMTINVPQLRADYDGRCGIAHLA